jgi:hypothetical protein
MVERRVFEWQRARVTYLEDEAGIARLLPGVLDVHGRKIDAVNGANAGILCQREREAAGAATDVEDPPGGCHPGEADEQRRQLSAPATHLGLVSIAVA